MECPQCGATAPEYTHYDGGYLRNFEADIMMCNACGYEEEWEECPSCCGEGGWQDRGGNWQECQTCDGEGSIAVA